MPTAHGTTQRIGDPGLDRMSHTASAQPESGNQASSSRPLWLRLVPIGLGALVALWVSYSVFQGLMRQGGEQDAKDALRWIATEMTRTAPPDSQDLASWLQNKPILRHRLGDARQQGTDVAYHGYLLGWSPEDSGGGVLWAEPLRRGVTGSTPYRVTLSSTEWAGLQR